MTDNLKDDFRKIVEEHKSSIYSVCFMFAESREVADDLFQEVLINLWKGFSGFRGDSGVGTWVYRVSMNTCISYKRKKKIKTEPLDINTEIFDNETPPGRQASQLRDRISRLEPFDRAIVLLWLENLPYDEIAAITGLSPNAVGVRLLRIKEKLKNL